MADYLSPLVLFQIRVFIALVNNEQVAGLAMKSLRSPTMIPLVKAYVLSHLALWASGEGIQSRITTFTNKNFNLIWVNALDDESVSVAISKFKLVTDGQIQVGIT
jgi:hypothetical protein